MERFEVPTNPTDSIQGLPVTWDIDQRRLELIRFANHVMEMRTDVSEASQEFIKQAANEHGLILTNIVQSEMVLSIAEDMGKLASTWAQTIELSFQQCDDEQALLQSLYGAASNTSRIGEGIPVSVAARQHLKADY